MGIAYVDKRKAAFAAAALLLLESLARGLCDFHGWFIPDGCAGGGTGACARENKRISPGGSPAAGARQARDDSRGTVEAPERTDRRARSSGKGCAH